uniref:Uncharacterized protein n=1 Tax=Xenopus tropicalis TaxID=8364 RepID=A0A803K557_XENTR
MQSAQGNQLILPYTLQEILGRDTVQVELIPEKKGLFLKHVEYEVSSQYVRNPSGHSVTFQQQTYRLRSAGNSRVQTKIYSKDPCTYLGESITNFGCPVGSEVSVAFLRTIKSINLSTAALL